MKTWAKRKPSPSMLVALLALFVALGGSAVAAKTGVFKVRSKNIVNGQVKTPDLGKNSVTGVKIRNGQVGAADIGDGAVGSSELAPGAVGAAALGSGSVGAAALAPGAVGGGALGGNSVNSSKVQDNSLTGADIDESTLGGVDASTLGGASRCAASQRIEIGKGALDVRVLCTIGPFTISARCESDAGSSMLGAILMTTTEGGSFYSTDAVKEGWEDSSLSDPAWETKEEKAIIWHNEFEEGDGGSVSPPVTFNAFAPGGQSISGQASVRADSAAGGARICDIVLSAIG